MIEAQKKRGDGCCTVPLRNVAVRLSFSFWLLSVQSDARQLVKHNHFNYVLTQKWWEMGRVESVSLYSYPKAHVIFNAIRVPVTQPYGGGGANSSALYTNPLCELAICINVPLSKKESALSILYEHICVIWSITTKKRGFFNNTYMRKGFMA